MFKRLVLALSGAALCLASSGCYTTHIGTPGLRNYASLSKVGGTKVGTFDVNYRRWYVLWGLVPLGQPDVEADMKAELTKTGGKAIGNLQIDTGMDFPWLLLNAVTGIITVYNGHAQVTGDIMK